MNSVTYVYSTAYFQVVQAYRDPVQTPRSALFAYMSLKNDSRLIWVKYHTNTRTCVCVLGQRQTVQTHSQIRHRIVLFSVISIVTVCLQNARTRYYQLSKSYSQTKNNNTSTHPLPPPKKKKKKKNTKKKTNKQKNKKTKKIHTRKTFNPKSVQCTPRFL